MELEKKIYRAGLVEHVPLLELPHHATRKDTTNHRAEWKHGLVDRALMLAAAPLMEGNSIGEELLNDAMNGNVADQLRTRW
jgi:hypothetical protein